MVYFQGVLPFFPFILVEKRFEGENLVVFTFPVQSDVKNWKFFFTHFFPTVLFIFSTVLFIFPTVLFIFSTVLFIFSTIMWWGKKVQRAKQKCAWFWITRRYIVQVYGQLIGLRLKNLSLLKAKEYFNNGFLNFACKILFLRFVESYRNLPYSF